MDWAQKVFPAAQQVTLYKARTKSQRFKIAAKRDKAGEAPLTQVWGGLFLLSCTKHQGHKSVRYNCVHKESAVQ